MATIMIDIGLDQNHDLFVENGDFSFAESTATHQEMLIINSKGDYKQNPTICVGALNYLDDENFDALSRAISIEFARDGMNVVSVQLSPAGIVLSDAFYP